MWLFGLQVWMCWPLGQGWRRWFFYRSHPGLGLVPKNNLRLEFSVAQFAICDIYCLRKIFSAALVCYFGIRHLAIAAQHRRRQLSPTMKVRWEKILDRCALWNLKIASASAVLDIKQSWSWMSASTICCTCWIGKTISRSSSWDNPGSQSCVDLVNHRHGRRPGFLQARFVVFSD